MERLTIDVLPVLIAQVALQVALALVLALILGAFYRAHRHPYLRHWSLSWLALVVYVLASLGAGLATAGRSPAWHVPVVAVSLVAGFLQVAWLLLGARGLARDEEVPAGTVRLVLLAAVVGAALSLLPALVGLTVPSAVGLRCLVAGLAYIAASVGILARRPTPARVGGTFAGFALLLYAVDQLAYFALSFVPRGGQIGLLPLLMTFDLLATAVIGLALVAWLLEGERERQVHAVELARRRERAQACVYRISEAARTVWDLPALFRSIHESLGDVLPARNFYIALHDGVLGPAELPVLRRRARLDPGPEAARPRPHRVRPADAPAPPGDARGLPGASFSAARWS